MGDRRSCDVENIADFSRYYGNSWVGWHDEKLNFVKPCFVGGALDQNTVQLRPLAKREHGQFLVEGGIATNWETLKEHIDFGVPDIGMIPDGPTILYTSYTTPRVAKKGFRSRDTMIADFNTWDIRKKFATLHGTDKYDTVWFAFNPEYVSLEQAEDKLSKGELVGVPISRTLGVYSSYKFKFSLLAYKRWTVGHVISPFLVQLKKEYGDYEEDIARQTGAEVIVR